MGTTRRTASRPRAGSATRVNANGNLTARGADGFSYDQANRLKTFNTTAATYSYDGDADAQALSEAYDETLRLYELHFGPPPEDLWVRSGASRCPNCGNRCK